MKMTKGQGAFEYMMSYGWAVLVIVVLAVVLWNLGVFNPSSATTATGFAAVRPVAWSFQGIGVTNIGVANSLYISNATLAFANIAGIDLTIALNGSNSANDTVIKFAKPGAALCGFYGPILIKDEFGNTVSIANVLVGIKRYGTVGLPAGKQLVVSGMVTGPNYAADQNYTCGGPSGGVYRYTISYQSALDQFNIQHTDAGTVTGTFQ